MSKSEVCKHGVPSFHWLNKIISDEIVKDSKIRTLCNFKNYTKPDFFRYSMVSLFIPTTSHFQFVQHN
jgi:hypothetical protein